KRGRYLFDGATNWLAGSGPSSSMHQLLKELFDFSQLQIIDPDIFISVEYNNAHLHVYCDAERLREEMLRVAPEDARVISKFTSAIKKAGTISLPFQKAPELFNLWDYCTFLFSQFSFILFFMKWKRVSIRSLSGEFKNSTLRELFLRIFPRHEHFSVLSVILTLGWMNIKSGGYPIGGSNKLTDLLVQKYQELGGKLMLRSEVTSITMDNNRATGIRLKNGTTIPAAKVVVAADLQYTITKLLSDNKHIQKSADRLAAYPVFPALFQVSLGVKREFKDLPHKITMPLSTAIDCGSGGILSEMMVRIGNFDPTFSPSGTTAIIVHIRTPEYRFWCDLRDSDYKKYTEEKKRVAEQVINSLDSRFGMIREAIEEIDIATPATFIRYTNIFKGSYQSWAPTPSFIGKTLPKTINSVKNLFITGQWVWAAGGIPGVIRIARHTAQIICHGDKKKFLVRKN
ncbi:MAG TPA: FAD-dependent oxidoreductase, partial [Chitinispirillaceae bacterium]|nr:FAD-dependent oxidoreductase [Chitinispirillaceae bacterium]